MKSAFRGSPVCRVPALPAFAALAALAGCGSAGEPLDGVSSFRVTVVQVNDEAPPAADAPLPANRGDTTDAWAFEVQAHDALGTPVAFDGVVRVRVEPGAVMTVVGEGAMGRNLRLTGGVASGVAMVTAVYGPARLWIEDIGYVPHVPESSDDLAACANGKNDDGGDDVLIDFPADPGCAYADDATEEGGTFSAGISPPVAYALPRISDIQGSGSETPYPFEGMEVNTGAPQKVVVTRVSSDGFYVTDLSEADTGYNHLFAFNFNTPFNMRVCDRVEYLAGTVNEFFGFTELSFPSYRLGFLHEGDACEVPEPTVLDAPTILDPITMEKLESGLVRVQGYHIAQHFGPKPAVNNVFLADQSSCDLNGDGQVDFESQVEGSCSNACAGDPECTEWTSFSARGNYKVSNGSSMIQIQTGTVTGFDPTSHKGEVLDSVTGTLRNFSGGSLNWTIEARCPDDLACTWTGCKPTPVPSSEACVRLRSLEDPDSGTN